MIYEGKLKGARYAVASMQGWRIDMEDAHVVKIPMSDEPPFSDWSFFAVFDGHAGTKAAQHSAENILKTLLATAQFRKVCTMLLPDFDIRLVNEVVAFEQVICIVVSLCSYNMQQCDRCALI